MRRKGFKAAGIIFKLMLAAVYLAPTWMVLVNSLKEKNDEAGKTIEGLNQQVSDLICQRNIKRERDAYNQGLYDGRATDTLYRKMLSKYSSGEQATVMMYGEETTERRNG